MRSTSNQPLLPWVFKGAIIGVLGGFLGARYAQPDTKRIRMRAVGLSLAGSAVGIFVLAMLDKIIGPW